MPLLEILYLIYNILITFANLRTLLRNFKISFYNEIYIVFILFNFTFNLMRFCEFISTIYYYL